MIRICAKCGKPFAFMDIKVRVPGQFDRHHEVLSTIETHFSDRLNDWEAGFIDSITRQLGVGKSLTDGQKKKLDEVFERVSNQGRG